MQGHSLHTPSHHLTTLSLPLLSLFPKTFHPCIGIMTWPKASCIPPFFFKLSFIYGWQEKSYLDYQLDVEKNMVVSASLSLCPNIGYQRVLFIEFFTPSLASNALILWFPLLLSLLCIFLSGTSWGRRHHLWKNYWVPSPAILKF